jgi:hypothetical protein
MIRARCLPIGSLILSLVLILPAAHATAIAILRTPSEIVIAADSRETNFPQGSTRDHSCKIMEATGVVFAPTGTVSSTGGFDVDAIAFQALKNTAGTLKERVLRFDSLIKDALQSLVYEIKDGNYTKAQKEKFFSTRHFLGIAFAAVENNVSVLVGRDFDASISDPIVKRGAYECPGNECPNGEVVVLSSMQRNLQEKFFKTHRHLDRDLVELARSFVQEHIDEGVPDVAPPIDIVRLTSRGIEWLQRKPGC